MTAEYLEQHTFGQRVPRRSYLTRADEAVPPRVLIKSMLLPDETLLQVGLISEGIYWQSFAWLIFGVVFILILALFGVPFTLILLLTFFLTLKIVSSFVLAYLTRYYLLLAVTDKRVIYRFGILNLEVMQLSYSKIEGSEVASTLAGRLFGYSSLFVSGTGGHTLAVPYVVNAMQIRKTITEIIMRRDEEALHPVVL